MTRNRPSFADRLAERGWVDRWGFLVFALGGAAAILVAKHSGLDPVYVAVGAAGIMVAYAAIAQTSGTGRLRGDQAGDNCYYLGLIYTLTSLGYAIFFFNPSDQATSIIQGFGVALATTVMGLMLRVFFNQTRVDLVQTEDTARIELAEAAGRMKAELSSAVVSMNDFSRQTRQSLEELRNGIVESLTEVHEAAKQTILETASRAKGDITEQANETNARAKRFTTATEKVLGGIERHASTLGGIDATSSQVANSLAALEAAAVATQSVIEQLARHAAQLSSAQTDMTSVGGDLRQTAQGLVEHVQALNTSIERFDQRLAKRLDEVLATPIELANTARRDFELAVDAVRESMESLAKSQGDLAKRLSDGALDSVSTLGRHNEALELELTRSRGHVAKVHSALVDMTSQLADSVESRTPG